MEPILTCNQARACIEKIRAVIQSYFREHNLTYAVFGKSEGLDSSVIAGLLADLEGVRPIGVLMPCESKPEVKQLAKSVLDHFKIPSLSVDLTPQYHNLMGQFYSEASINDQLLKVVSDYGDRELHNAMAKRKAIASGNIKVRLRMITLYHIAQLTGGLVISTDNLSEMWMGFWTINGDVGDFSPIQYVLKGLEEPVLAEVLGVPIEARQVVPTDGLDITPGGTDQDQLGLPYNELDRVIVRLLQKGFDGSGPMEETQQQDLIQRIGTETGHPADMVKRVAQRLAGTHFKRNWPRKITRDEAGLPEIATLKIH